MPENAPQKPIFAHLDLVEKHIEERRKDGNWDYPYTEIREGELANEIDALGGFSIVDGEVLMSESVFEDAVTQWSYQHPEYS